MREPRLERVTMTDPNGREWDVAELSVEAKCGGSTSILVRLPDDDALRPLREGEWITFHETVTIP